SIATQDRPGVRPRPHHGDVRRKEDPRRDGRTPGGVRSREGTHHSNPPALQALTVLFDSVDNHAFVVRRRRVTAKGRASRFRQQNSSKNFGTAGINCHTDVVCTPVWTTCGQPSDQPEVRSQHGPRPQCTRPPRPTVHNPLTTRHTRHAGPTVVYPQCPQPLILLLVYLPRFFFEEAAWGHIEKLGAKPLC